MRELNKNSVCCRYPAPGILHQAQLTIHSGRAGLGTQMRAQLQWTITWRSCRLRACTFSHPISSSHSLHHKCTTLILHLSHLTIAYLAYLFLEVALQITVCPAVYIYFCPNICSWCWLPWTTARYPRQCVVMVQHLWCFRNQKP